MAENQELNIVVKLVDQASQGLKGMSDSLDKFWKKVDEQTQGAQNFTKAIIWTAAVVWGVAVNKFMDFEKTMSGVKAVLSPTTEEFDKLNEKAKQLWKDSIYSQSEVAQSIEMLAKNGLDATQILNGAADATINLAAAAGTDLSTAADLATDTMAIFGIQAENMSRAINGISGVAVASKFTVDDYRLALAQGWWVAKAVWVQFEDFNTAIAAISPLFASGSDAGTSYKVFLQRLVPASKWAEQAMEDLWLRTKDWANLFFDASGKLKSMGEIAWLLQKGLKWLSDEQKNQALQTIFGTDAMRAAVGLADVGAEKFAELNAQIQGTNAAEQAKTRLDNLAGSFEQLMGTLDVILIDLGAAISVVLRPAIDWLTNALEDVRATFQGLSPEMQTTLSIIGGVAAGFAGLLLVVGSIWIVLPAITAALSAITGALAFLLSPIGLVIAAVAALAIAWQINFLWIQDITKQVFEDIKPYFEGFMEGLKDIWDSATNAMEGIKKAFTTVFEYLKPYIKSVVDIIKNFWNAHFKDVISIVQWAWTIIKSLFQGAFDIMQGIFKVFAGLFTWDWKILWEGLKSIATGFWTIIKWLFSGWFNFIKWALWVFSGVVRAAWDGLFTGLKLVANTGWNAIKAAWQLFWEGLKSLFSMGWGALSSAWSSTMNSISGIATSIWNGVQNTIASSMNWIVNKINSLIWKVNSVSSKIWIPNIPSIWNFQNGWIVGYETGGIVPGSKLPANHDQVPAMLDPGELILNRAQQKNIATQLTTSGQTVNINLWNVNITNWIELNDFLSKIKEVVYQETRKANLWLIL